MQDLELSRDGDDGTVFRDVIMLARLGFAALVMLLLPHLNPPVQATEQREPPGNLVIELRWPDGLDADLDLWVQAPDDAPVGYSNKGWHIFNLLRDDIGRPRDSSDLNYEIAFSRGTPSSEYTVNVHLYRNNSDRRSIPATVSAGIKSDVNGPVESIAEERIELRRVGRELTVVRFSLDQSGNLVPGSVHNLQRALRSPPGATRPVDASG